ncbi:MAG TPA: dihydrolipoyl dehydrogenase, partial [Candidatus Xenobia bacterium]
MAEEGYDVVIIGSGPGGYVAAIRAGQLGLKTALVEKDRALGGTCLHRGCIPTKSWLHTAWLYDHMKRSEKIGIIAKDVLLDFTLVQAEKDRVVDKLSKGVEGLMRKNKVTVVKGVGGLAGPGQVAIEGAPTLKTRHIVLAMGSVPRMVPGVQVAPGRIVTSDELLQLETVPKSIAVLGAGAVGVEFASVFHRFGSEVHLVEMLPRMVPLEDEELSKELERSFKKKGINIYTDHRASDFMVGKDAVKFKMTPGSGDARELSVELVLVAVGRAPVTTIAGLDKTSIKLDRGYIPVDEYGRTTEPNVYAIGDIITTSTGKHPQLAHAASAEGILAVEHMAGQETRPINYDQVPNATYCDPEVASIGLSEAEAKRRGYAVKVGKFPFSAVSKATIEHESEGFVKIVADE